MPKNYGKLKNILKPLEIPEAGHGKPCIAGRSREAEGDRPYRLRYDFHLDKFLVTVLVVALSPVVMAQTGETIVFDGSDPSILQSVTLPGTTYASALAPTNSHSGASDSLVGSSITINNGTVDAVFGAFNRMDLGNVAANSVTNNKVVMNDGSVNSYLYDGWTHYGDAEDNKVTINGGTVAWNLYGGYSDSGNATSNSVNMSDGKVRSNLYGGYSDSGNATSNSVNMSGGNVLYLYGGSSNSGNAVSNSVNMSGGKVWMYLYGGRSYSGNAVSNSVNMSGGTVMANIYGGLGTNVTRNSNCKQKVVLKTDIA